MLISGVKGLVRDENNNSVPNAVIVIKGREQVPFMTSQRGEYWKLLLPGSYTLLVCVAVCRTLRAHGVWVLLWVSGPGGVS